MAETRVVNLEVKDNSEETAKNFNKVADSIENVEKGIDGIGKSTKNADGGLKKISLGIKAIGLSFKAAGIGLIIGAFVALKEVFMQNQKVADLVSTAFETVSIVFNEVTRVILDTYESVSKATGGFDALGKVIGGLITISLAPLKAAFYGIKLGVQEVQLIWEKSFFGNKDLSTIANLRKEIKATQNDIANVGKGVVQAGKDIGNNFVEAVGEVGSFVTQTAKGISDISVKAAFEQAKLNVAIQNAAKIAAAQQSILIEKYDRAAEKLRQVRDEERNSIDERIKANNQLGEVLEKQQKALLKQADLQVQAARNELKKSNNIENQVALLETLANREGVLAQIEGLRSEQLANDLALNREKLELTQTLLESETDLANEQKRFDAERIEDELKRFEKLKEVIQEEKDIELGRLQTKIDSYKEGTQARLDAEIEYNTVKQQLDNELIILEDENRKYIDEQDQIYADKQKERDKELLDSKYEMTYGTLNALMSLNDLFNAKNEKDARRQFKINKALSLAQASIQTFQAVTGALTAGGNPVKLATGAQFIEAGIAATIGAANIAKIAGTEFEGGGTIGGGGGVQTPNLSTPQSVQPNFNIVGDSGVNQLDALKSQPSKVYVVSGEVSSAQALDRNRIRNATF
jgi:hypothetical protein